MDRETLPPQGPKPDDKSDEKPTRRPGPPAVPVRPAPDPRRQGPPPNPRTRPA
jgi:hypothetical protein